MTATHATACSNTYRHNNTPLALVEIINIVLQCGEHHCWGLTEENGGMRVTMDRKAVGGGIADNGNEH